MTPEQIADALTSREWGWKPTIVSAEDAYDLSPIVPGHLMKCVDGRASDNVGVYGPKVLGGVYGIASVRGATSERDLANTVREVLDAGYTPSAHGDEGRDCPTMGCGYFKLWSQGKLTTLSSNDIGEPEYDSDKGAQIVLAAGGAYERLYGAHSEKEVVINLVPNTTLAPSDPQRFVVDAWITAEFDLDVGIYLTAAAETVELLSAKGGPHRVTKVRIIAP